MKTIVSVLISLFLFNAFSKDLTGYFVNTAIDEYCLSLLEVDYCLKKGNTKEVYSCGTKERNSKARIEYNLKEKTGHIKHKDYQWIKNKIYTALKKIVKKDRRCEKLKDKNKYTNCIDLSNAEWLEEIIGICSQKIKDKKSLFFRFLKE